MVFTLTKKGKERIVVEMKQEYTIKKESSKVKMKYKWCCIINHPYYTDYSVVISSYSYKSCKKKVIKRLNKWEVDKDNYKEVVAN